MTVPDNRPIGVFDSGVGGLTVLQAIHDLLPRESTVYLGDLCRCPYGPRPQSQVRQFAGQIAEHLIGQQIKLLVIACNTATAAAFEWLRDTLPVPVVGVIGPGARAAADLTRNGRIGVLATDGTVASGAYGNALRRIDPGLTPVERSASWLVPMIEEGSPARTAVALQLAPTLTEMREQRIDTLILGCTHFPIIRDIFDAEAGPGIAIVDSAVTTAREVKWLLDELDLHAAGEPEHRLLVTGPAEAFAQRARAMFRASPPIETVDLALDPVP